MAFVTTVGLANTEVEQGPFASPNRVLLWETGEGLGVRAPCMDLSDAREHSFASAQVWATLVGVQ